VGLCTDGDLQRNFAARISELVREQKLGELRSV